VFDVPVTVDIEYADRKTAAVLVPVTDQIVEKRVPLDGPLRNVEISRDDGTLAEFSR
jgi:hypothetical protein